MEQQKLVYLAGIITGATYEEATGWREQLPRRLPAHIKCLSPLRGKQYLEERSTGGVISMTYEDFPLCSARGINTRDHWDVQRSDAVFVNLLNAPKISVGTVMEIAWAYAYRKPLILVMEPGGLHEHCMIQECTGFRVHSLEEGIDVLKALFL